MQAQKKSVAAAYKHTVEILLSVSLPLSPFVSCSLSFSPLSPSLSRSLCLKDMLRNFVNFDSNFRMTHNMWIVALVPPINDFKLKKDFPVI